MNSHSTPTTDSEPDRTTWRDVTLKASGCAFLVGDAALFAAGWRENSVKTGSAGLLWSVGGLSTAWYANPNQEKQLALLNDRLGNYFRQHGVTIPDTPTTHALLRHQGLLDHVQDYFYRHPTDLMNATGLLGAGQLIRSGLKKRFLPDLASGAVVAAGALAGLLIPEKQPDPDHPPEGMGGRILSTIQEKPLRITGALQGMNNVAMFWGAAKKQREFPHQGGHAMRYAAAGSYMLANTLLFMSAKDSKHNVSQATLQQIADVAAQVVAAQPEPQQHALLKGVAQHLAEQAGSMDAGQIESLLNAHLANRAPQHLPAPIATERAR